MSARLSLLVALLLLAGACGGGGQGAEPAATQAGGEAGTAASGAPIRVGAVSSITGPAVFPEAAAAAQAVFDRVNEQGGIQGRPIEYLVEDDRADPAVASQAARKLVDDREVVAMVGSASLVECLANAAFYAERDVMAIQGTGVDPACFSSSNISPVNTGPFQAMTVGLYFASEVLEATPTCVFISNRPDFFPAYEAAVERWERITGKEIHLKDRSMKPEDDLTPLVLQAQRAGCKGVYNDGLDFQAIAWMKAVEAQGVEGIEWVFPTSVYTVEVAETLGSTGNGMYAGSEFEPFTSDSEILDDWRELLTANDVPLTSFAQGGYLAATIFVEVLNGIEGEITRASVRQALLEFEGYEHPFVGAPYSFGPGEAHNPNKASKFVQLQDGEWLTTIDEWVVLPD